jgi:hypothetical protein
MLARLVHISYQLYQRLDAPGAIVNPMHAVRRNHWRVLARHLSKSFAILSPATIGSSGARERVNSTIPRCRAGENPSLPALETARHQLMHGIGTREAAREFPSFGDRRAAFSPRGSRAR